MTEDERERDLQEQLRALQRRAFAADGDAAGDPAVARAMAELRAQLTAARPARTAGSRLTPAAGSAATDQAETAASGPAANLEAAPGTGGGPAAASPDASARVDAAGGQPRRRLVAGLAGALVLGAVIGGTVGATVRPGLPGQEAAAGATAAADQPVRAASVFARLQTTKDIPLVAMPDAFVAESFRYLGSAGWTDADADGVTDSPYYAARSTSDQICLVVVPEGSGYLSTCAPEAEYPPAGLRLTWQSNDLHPGVPGGTPGMVLDVTVAWLSDSTVETRGSGRPQAAP